MPFRPIPEHRRSSDPAPVDAETAVDQAAEDAQFYRGVLHELIGMGTDMARLVHQQATAQANETSPESKALATPAPDLTIAFDRIARAIRRTVALARKLAEPAPAPAAGNPASYRSFARRRVIREVEDAIQRGTRGSEAAALRDELLIRLDGPDIDEDLDHRPIVDIIADICRDLGIAVPQGANLWKRRTPEDIATLFTRAHMPTPTPRRPEPPARPTNPNTS